MSSPTSFPLPPDRPSAWRRFAERHRLVARAGCEAWDQATTPALIAEGSYRRFGAGHAFGSHADHASLLHALARAPGWTPLGLQEAYESLPQAQVAALRATAENPHATMEWFHAACRWSWNEALSTAFWIEAWVDRLAGPTPPPGWLHDASTCEMLLLACGAVPPDGPRNPQGLNGQVLMARLVTAAVAQPDITDDDLAALARLIAVWDGRSPLMAGRVYHVSERLTQILCHSVAGESVRRMWMNGTRYPSHPLLPWEDLPTLRPDWLALPDIRAAINALTPILGSAEEVFFYVHADPEVAATRWSDRLEMGDVEGALGVLGLLPPAVLAALPLTTHDLEQCLAHAPTADMRLALIAALPYLPTTAGDEPPAVYAAASCYDDLPVPVIPDTLAAHHPAIQEWLATHDPGYQRFRAQVLDRLDRGLAERSARAEERLAAAHASRRAVASPRCARSAVCP